MAKKKRKIDRFGPITLEERMKYEIAEEMGLLPKVIGKGWAGLSTAETGRVGGVLRARLKQLRGI